MPMYRLYVLNKEHVARPPVIMDCADDDGAINEAEKYINGRVMETWNCARLVSRLGPNGPPPYPDDRVSAHRAGR